MNESKISVQETTDQFDFDTMVALPPAAQKSSSTKIVLEYEIRKPSYQEYFRTKSDEASYWLFEEKKDGLLYLVNPALAPSLLDDIFSATLVLAMNRDAEAFIIVCKAPSFDGEPYATSRLEGVEAARKGWIRLRTKTGEKGYTVIPAGGTLPEPIWPDEPFKAILKKAFAGRYIMNLEHPALKRLRGEL